MPAKQHPYLFAKSHLNDLKTHSDRIRLIFISRDSTFTEDFLSHVKGFHFRVKSENMLLVGKLRSELDHFRLLWQQLGETYTIVYRHDL